MRSVKAIFIKQVKDMAKNLSVLIMFVIVPFIAFVMTEFIARGNNDIPDSMFVITMSSIFVGTLVQPACTIIAEDREKKSLRFLIIAGVKPLAYLLGIGGATFTVSIFSSLALGYIGGFSQDEFMTFMAVRKASLEFYTHSK